MTSKTYQLPKTDSFWGALVAAFFVLLSGLGPARGEVLCIKGNHSIDKATGLSHLTVHWLPPIDDPQQLLRSECDARLLQQKARTEDFYLKQFQKQLQQAEQLKQKQERLAASHAEALQQREAQLQQCEAELQNLDNDIGELRKGGKPRGGAQELAAFPNGESSPDLAVAGGMALAGSFLLGLQGRRTRRARLASGLITTLVSFCAYLGTVTLLPNTLTIDLLLAMAVALLCASLGERLQPHLLPVPEPVPEPSRPIRRRPGRPPPRGRADPAADAGGATADLLDPYTLEPLDLTDRQQRFFRCQGCNRIYREASLEAMRQESGGSCYVAGCGSRDFREYSPS